MILFIYLFTFYSSRSALIRCLLGNHYRTSGFSEENSTDETIIGTNGTQHPLHFLHHILLLVPFPSLSHSWNYKLKWKFHKWTFVKVWFVTTQQKVYTQWYQYDCENQWVSNSSACSWVSFFSCWVALCNFSMLVFA